MNLSYLTDIIILRKKAPQGFIQAIRGIGYTASIATHMRLNASAF
jgi:hypothetical protein